METTGQVYVYDLLRHSQYVYGHELNSDKWGLYNIDIDPYLGTFSVLEPGGLLNAFLELCAAIQLYKKKFGLDVQETKVLLENLQKVIFDTAEVRSYITKSDIAWTHVSLIERIMSDL